MHIAYCLTHSGVGGGQQIIYSLVKSLLANHPNIRITVILPSGGEYVNRFQQLDVNVIEFPTNRLSVFLVVAFWNVLRKLDIDILHSHGKGAGFYCRIIPRLFLRIVRVHSYHGFHPPTEALKKKLYYFLERILLSTVEQLVMVSRSEAEELTSLFAIKKEYVSVIQNIVECYDAGSETQEPDGINKILKEYRVPFKICMIGRNDPVKNYPLAFETIRLFLDETKEKALFVLVGISHDDAALRRLREEYLENIIVLEQSNGASTILSYCNALLITSKKEGCPLVVLESFCCGKPVVGTNVPGIYDLVTDGINGLLCPQNARELSKALHRLIEDGNLYQTLSDNARAYGSAMNTRDWAMEYFRLYKTLLNK